MRPGKRRVLDDLITAALLIAVTYATPARLRPALGLVLAVALSRQHGRNVEAVRLELVRLFDERHSAHARLDAQGVRLDELAARLEELRPEEESEEEESS